MVEAMQHRGAFAGWTTERVGALLKDVFNDCLVKLDREAFIGFSCTVDLRAHRLVSAEHPHMKSPEALCTAHCVDIVTKAARYLYQPDGPPPRSIEMTFDRGEPYGPLAQAAWGSDPPPWWADAVLSIGVADWRAVRGLQAADLGAWTWNRHYTKQDQDWLAAGVTIMKAQFHRFYGEAELRALP